MTITEYRVGSKAKITVRCIDSSGRQADPDSIYAYAKKPVGGQVVVFTTDPGGGLERVSEGFYRASFLLDQRGEWRYGFKTTGDPHIVFESVFSVGTAVLPAVYPPAP